jgi:ADP-ribose pyrophosphatase YjhB (NUDIX family)
MTDSSISNPRVPAEGTWKSFAEPRPYVTVSGFAYDSNGTFPLLYRSDKVRSAKNCWSLPSGLHEVGLTFEEQFAAELKEELNLEPVTGKGHLVGIYENIAVIDSWHWCIVMMAMQVKTLDTLVNKEPERHSAIQRVHFNRLQEDDLLEMAWAPSLKEALEKYRLRAYEAIYLDLKRPA